MASLWIRSITRSTISAIKSHLHKSKPSSRPSSFTKSAPSPSLNRRFASIARLPVELGCLGGGSLYPLHNTVAEARLTSRLSTGSRSSTDLSQGTLCCTYPGL